LSRVVVEFSGLNDAGIIASVCSGSGISGRRATVFLRRCVRCAGHGYDRRQCNGGRNADLRSHENPPTEGSIMANGNVDPVADPRREHAAVLMNSP